MTTNLLRWVISPSEEVEALRCRLQSKRIILDRQEWEWSEQNTRFVGNHVAIDTLRGSKWKHTK